MSNKIKLIIFSIIGALFFMFDAFYNGFPIVYSDTSTYIISGFGLETPFDRPITYGILLRLFSLNGLSLWCVIFFQALLLSALILILLKHVLQTSKYLLVGLAIIFCLALLTGVSWTVSQLMSDIFTAIALLSAAIILLGKYAKVKKVFLYFIFFVSVATHMSHVLLFNTIIIFTFVFSRYILPINQFPNRNKKLLSLLLLTNVSIILMGSALAKSKHVFFMGAMVEHGIAKKYLDTHCKTNPYKLCAYKDSLPDKGYVFVWDEAKSPFYKIGGWKNTKGEFDSIISGSLSEPKFIALHIKASFKATVEQLFRNDIGDGNGSFLKGTILYERIDKYFKHELESYSNSLQSRQELGFTIGWSKLFDTIIIASLMVIAILLFLKRELFDYRLKFITFFFTTGVLLNAWDCGTFANAIGRLGCKMIWLLPFIALILLSKLIIDKNVGNKESF